MKSNYLMTHRMRSDFSHSMAGQARACAQGCRMTSVRQKKQMIGSSLKSIVIILGAGEPLVLGF